jgi:hypothetical protein
MGKKTLRDLAQLHKTSNYVGPYALSKYNAELQTKTSLEEGLKREVDGYRKAERGEERG